MSEIKNFKKKIPKLYQKNYENLMAFAWVKAHQYTGISISITDSIKRFIKESGLSEDDFNYDSALIIYQLTNKSFLTLKKDDIRKKSKINIPGLYKYSAIYVMMYAWMAAIKNIGINQPEKNTIEDFINFFGFDLTVNKLERGYKYVDFLMS